MACSVTVWRLRLAGSIHYTAKQDVDLLRWHPAPVCGGTAGATCCARSGPAVLQGALDSCYMRGTLPTCLPDPPPDVAGLRTLHLSGRALSGRCSVSISAGLTQTTRYDRPSHTPDSPQLQGGVPESNTHRALRLVVRALQ